MNLFKSQFMLFLCSKFSNERVHSKENPESARQHRRPYGTWPLAPSTFLLSYLHLLLLLCSHCPSGCFLILPEHFCIQAFALAITLVWNILLQDLCRANIYPRPPLSLVFNIILLQDLIWPHTTNDNPSLPLSPHQHWRSLLYFGFSRSTTW